MKTILCYGDSNTYGFNPADGMRYPKEVRWTGILSRKLGEKFEVLEEGCNGRTTVFDDPVDGWKNGLDYLMPCLNTHKPVDLVILMLGSNDLKTCFHATADQITAGIARVIDEIVTFGHTKQNYVPEILLVSPPHVGEKVAETGSGFSEKFDETAVTRSKELAAKYQRIAQIKNCYFFDAATVAKASDIDCLHLSPEGHSDLAEGIFEWVKKLFRIK